MGICGDRAFRLTLLGLLISLNFPSICLAQNSTKAIALTLDANAGEGFSQLLQKAEAMANQAVQSEFAPDPTFAPTNDRAIDQITVVVSISRFGLVAPVLTANVKRSQWQSNPSLSAWSRQILRTAELLGYEVVTPIAIAKSRPPATPSVYGTGFIKINRPAGSSVPSVSSASPNRPSANSEVKLPSQPVRAAPLSAEAEQRYYNRRDD